MQEAITPKQRSTFVRYSVWRPGRLISLQLYAFSALVTTLEMVERGHPLFDIQETRNRDCPYLVPHGRI